MNQEIPLAAQLRACAQYLEDHDKVMWNAVCHALDKGNCKWWCGDGDIAGHTATEMAVKEIERLYAVERTVRLALTKAGES